MSNRLFVRLVAAGATLAGLVVTAGQAQASNEGASPGAAPGSSLAKGAVMRNGVPIRGADVVVRLWPDQSVLAGLADGERVKFHVAGVTRTDSDGRYELGIEPGSVPAGFIHEASGLVDVEVMVATSTEEMRWNYSARPSTSAQAAGGAWTLGQRPAGDPGGVVNTRLDFGVSSVWEAADDPLQWVDGSGRDLAEVPGVSRAAVSTVTRSPRTRSFDRSLEVALGRDQQMSQGGFRGMAASALDDSFAAGPQPRPSTSASRRSL